MTASTKRLEQDTLRTVERLREEYLPGMAALQLDVQAPELSHSVLSGGASSAEITMYVRRDDDIVDVVEFAVHRGGEAGATPEELEKWLRATFEDVLRRQREKGQGSMGSTSG